MQRRASEFLRSGARLAFPLPRSSNASCRLQEARLSSCLRRRRRREEKPDLGADLVNRRQAGREGSCANQTRPDTAAPSRQRANSAPFHAAVLNGRTLLGFIEGREARPARAGVNIPQLSKQARHRSTQGLEGSLGPHAQQSHLPLPR